MTLDLARWQFALTSVNHFFFVPVTIGLAFLTALLQTCWHRAGSPEYLRLTRFFGILLVINIPVGKVTGTPCWSRPWRRPCSSAASSACWRPGTSR
jgi:cytochrome bd ubiquinol oxidase subunit I